MRKRKTFVIIFLLLFALVGHQLMAEGPEKLSPADAIAKALQNNHDITIARLGESSAREDVNKAWKQLMPILESQAAVTRQGAESGYMSLSDGQYDLKVVQARVAINPGAFNSRLKLAVNSEVMAREKTRATRLKVESETIKAYFNVLLAGEMIELRRDSLIALEANLRDLQNLYRNGKVARYELLQAEVEVGNAKPLLFEARQNYSVAIDNFNYVIGTEERVFTADGAVLESRISGITADNFDAEVERLTEIALTNSPALVEVRLTEEISKNRKELQSSYYLWPTFSLSTSWGYTKLMPNDVDVSIPGAVVQPDFSAITGDDNWQNSWQVRAAATYRWGALTPLDSVRSDEKKEAIALLEKEEIARKLKKGIQIAVRSSYSQLVTAVQSIESQKKTIETAREGVRIVRASYKAGVAKNSELLNAELALTNARTAYINALYRYYTAIARLKYDLGVEDESVIFQ